MPQLTRAQILAAAKREARCTTSTTELDTLWDDFFDDMIERLFWRERCWELLVRDQQLTPSGAGVGSFTISSLNPTVQHVEQVRYTVDSGATFTRLEQKNDLTVRVTAPAPGESLLPKWWELVGSTLRIFPFSLVTTAHRVYLDYYGKPAALAAGDNFPVIRLQETFKLMLVERYLAWETNIKRLEATTTFKDDALGAALSAVPVGRARGPADTQQPDTNFRPEAVK